MDASDRLPRGRLGRLQRALGLFGLGALAALGWNALQDARARAAARPGRVAVWVADRDAHEVVGLGADLLRAATVDLAWPVEVEARRDGGAWVARSVAGAPSGEHRLVRLTAEGRVAAQVALGPLLDLDALDGEDALVLERRAEGVRVLRVDARGTVLDLGPRADGRVAACAGDRLALGGAQGRVAVHGLADVPLGPPLAATRLRGEVGDLAPGPRPGTWWALCVEQDGRARLLLLEPDLSARDDVPLPGRPRRLAPEPGGACVWLADTRAASVVLAREGAPVRVVGGLGLAGLERAAAWRGGVLVAAPGALLRRDGGGAPLPGQGGFAWLSDLSPVPPRRP